MSGPAWFDRGSSWRRVHLFVLSEGYREQMKRAKFLHIFSKNVIKEREANFELSDVPKGDDADVTTGKEWLR